MGIISGLPIIIQSIIIAVIITLAFPILGLVIESITNGLAKTIASKIGVFPTLVIFNYLTFVGVMHHELSHALMAFITGAKINEIALFKPQGLSLGHVNFTPRGGIILQSIQLVASSSAPVYIGSITSAILIYLLQAVITPLPIKILLIYVLISIFLHMTMSIPDFKCFFRGFFIVVVIITIPVFVALKYQLF